MIDLFRYLLWLRRYKRKPAKVGVFRRGVDHSECRFRREGSVAHHFWWQSSRVIALWCGIKISQMDGQTYGQTELRLPRPPLHMLVR